MWIEGLILIALAALVAAANASTTMRLWASPMFETSQKVGQTIFIWLVPGGFLVSRYLLREPTARKSADPATPGEDLMADQASAYAESSHHGGGGFGGDGGS